MPNEHFSGRTVPGFVVFDDKMWIIGGSAQTGNKNDVWCSSDGIKWELVNSAAGFSPRHGLGLVAYNNKMWLVGGVTGQPQEKEPFANDLWVSSDGVLWSKEELKESYPTRLNQHITLNGSILWLDTGLNVTAEKSVYLSDVWKIDLSK
jgi:hypothetical protein